jgi:UDP-perosamine 4-acetyltransferase
MSGEMPMTLQPLILLGSGGHAKVVIDIIEDLRRFDIVGVVSADDTEQTFLGYPRLGGDDSLKKFAAAGSVSAFVAIGDNGVRSRLLRKVRSLDFSVPSIISAKATVSRRAHLGSGVVIMPGAVINADTIIEDGVIVNTAASVDHDCVLRHCAHIGPGAHLAGGIVIDAGAFIGAGSTVVRRATIGAWSVVGAGSTVIRSVPAHAVAVGTPARLIRNEEFE